MDKFKLICVLFIIIVVLLLPFVYLKVEELEKRPPISLQELVINKAQYKDKMVKVRGVLNQCLDTTIKESFTVVFMPSGDIWIPIPVPVRERYYIYSLTDGNYSIAILSGSNLDKYLGYEIMVKGQVDGVYTKDNQVLDYVIKVEVVEK